jgi:hypothetical protein
MVYQRNNLELGDPWHWANFQVITVTIYGSPLMALSRTNVVLRSRQNWKFDIPVPVSDRAVQHEVGITAEIMPLREYLQQRCSDIEQSERERGPLLS